MEDSAISKVNNHVYKKYPLFSKSKPTVKPSGSNFILSYSAKVQLPDGKLMSQNLRVTSDSNGKVLKLSTSK